MQISPVKRADIPQIARLYDETVRRVNASDYIPGQIRAQAPRVYPDAFRQRRLRRYCVLVAEENGSAVGIVELTPKGEIDCFISVLTRGAARLIFDVAGIRAASAASNDHRRSGGE